MDAAAQAIQHQRLRAIVTKVVSNYRDKLDGLVRLIRAVSVLDGDAEQSAIQAIESTTKAGVAIAHEYMTVMRDMGVTDKEISEGLARGAKETDQLMQGNQPR